MNSNWINVEKVKPEFDTEILVLDDDGVQIAKYVVVQNESANAGKSKDEPLEHHIWLDQRRFDDGEIPLMIYPTHWMPLPEPPKEIEFDPNPVNIDE